MQYIQLNLGYNFIRKVGKSKEKISEPEYKRLTQL